MTAAEVDLDSSLLRVCVAAGTSPAAAIDTVIAAWRRDGASFALVEIDPALVSYDMVADLTRAAEPYGSFGFARPGLPSRQVPGPVPSAPGAHLMLLGEHKIAAIDGAGAPDAAWPDLLTAGQWELVTVTGHSEGTHLKLGEVVLCGLVGEAEQGCDGAVIAGGCGPGRCKRQRDSLTVVRLRDVHTRLLALLACNSVSLAGQAYPTTSSLARSSGAAATLGIVGLSRMSPAVLDRYAAALGAGGGIGDAARRLNAGGYLGGSGIGVVLGDPRTRLPAVPGPPPGGPARKRRAKERTATGRTATGRTGDQPTANEPTGPAGAPPPLDPAGLEACSASVAFASQFAAVAPDVGSFEFAPAAVGAAATAAAWATRTVFGCARTPTIKRAETLRHALGDLDDALVRMLATADPSLAMYLPSLLTSLAGPSGPLPAGCCPHCGARTIRSRHRPLGLPGLPTWQTQTCPVCGPLGCLATPLEGELSQPAPAVARIRLVCGTGDRVGTVLLRLRDEARGQLVLSRQARSAGSDLTIEAELTGPVSPDTVELLVLRAVDGVLAVYRALFPGPALRATFRWPLATMRTP